MFYYQNYKGYIYDNLVILKQTIFKQKKTVTIAHMLKQPRLHICYLYSKGKLLMKIILQ